MNEIEPVPEHPTPPLLGSVPEALEWLRARIGAGSGTLRTDSRQVEPGDVFIAWPGAATSGSSAMPQIGQFPGAAWRIWGCIGQV